MPDWLGGALMAGLYIAIAAAAFYWSRSDRIRERAGWNEWRKAAHNDLSIRDRWRVHWAVQRGKAVSDRRLAAYAVLRGELELVISQRSKHLTRIDNVGAVISLGGLGVLELAIGPLWLADALFAVAAINLYPVIFPARAQRRTEERLQRAIEANQRQQPDQSGVPS